MAWNDVRSSTNKAVHLLVTINGKQFNFKQATDLKVERKIGDTMSKFSLGIIDDSGSDQRNDYVEFERYILGGPVARTMSQIEIAYGNHYNDLQRFTGFVVDYQPVFFGNTTKLTVTGYLNRITSTTVRDKLTSPYSYWYDWTPYLGVRNDVMDDWAHIYNENGIVFNDDMKKAAKNLGASFETITLDTEINDAEITSRFSSLISSQEKAFNQANSEYERVLSNWFANNYSSVNWVRTDYERDPNSTGAWVSKSQTYAGADTTFQGVHIDWEGTTPKVVVTYTDGSGSVHTYTENLRSFVMTNNVDPTGSLGFNDLANVQNAYNKAQGLLLGLAKQDMIDAQEAAGEFKGAVPFHPDIMQYYDGNWVYETLEHPDTHRTLRRVRPDLFIKWDGVVPVSSLPDNLNIETLSEEDFKNYTQIFSHHVICDIKVFGLRYTVNLKKLKEGDVKNAYKLLRQDRWGAHRVLEIDGNYYIWVGDIPQLWQNFKASKDFEYQAQDPPISNFIKDETEASRKIVQWAAEKTYHEGEIVEFRYYAGDIKIEHRAEVIKNFTTGKNPNTEGLINWTLNGLSEFFVMNSTTDKKNKGLETLWTKAVNSGQLSEKETYSDWTEQQKTENYIRDYKIYALREKDKELGWINDKKTGERGNVVKGRDYNGNTVEMSREYRIRTYLQSAFRSAQPLAYGQVRISDIVKQLAYLEKWDDNEITSTVPSDYTSTFFGMEGQSALEYIANTLGPQAVEAGGGRVGFTTYFDKNTFVFKPVSMHYSYNAVYETGYNRRDSDVLSFTVRSRGIVLMSGVDDESSSLNAYTNEKVSAATRTKQDTNMSSDEAKLRQELSVYTQDSNTLNSLFFNLPLYYHYGNSSNSVQEFANFLTNINESASIAELPFASQTVIKGTGSSVSSSQDIVAKALYDLDKIKKTSIQAEMTVMGSTKLSPGTWIQVNNYTKRGPHYTSGAYFIHSITDQVTAGGAFTQNLVLRRYGEDVAAMNTGDTHLEAGISILQKYGMSKFEQWIQNYHPDIASQYNVVIDQITSQSVSVQSENVISANETKPNYTKVNGIESYGTMHKVDEDNKYNASHYEKGKYSGWWRTYVYEDSKTYIIKDDNGTIVKTGSVYDYKSFDGTYTVDRYGNKIYS